MEAFITTRSCECGRPLWAVMGEPEQGYALLVTLCAACDLRATLEDAEGNQSPANDSGASAQKD